jgi:hypothetical protein
MGNYTEDEMAVIEALEVASATGSLGVIRLRRRSDGRYVPVIVAYRVENEHVKMYGLGEVFSDTRGMEQYDPPGNGEDGVETHMDLAQELARQYEPPRSSTN